MSLRSVLLATVLALASLPAAAFERNFPPEALRGKMTPAPYPAIIIDGKSRQLSAGARIWSRENLIEQPASLRESSVPVNYTVNEQGEIDRIWILRTDEAAQSLASQTKK